MRNKAITVGLAIGLTAPAALAANDVLVEVDGWIWQNLFNVSEMATVNSGDTFTISFELDSTNYLDSVNYPTRGYVIDQSTFQINFSGGESVAMQNPYPGTPYFALRDNDPGVDGFFIGNSHEIPYPYIGLDEVGQLGQTSVRYYASYDQTLLDSLDILDALGTYGFAGMQVFGLGINDDWFEDVIGADFVEMRISAIPAPATLALLAPAAFFRRRRR